MVVRHVAQLIPPMENMKDKCQKVFKNSSETAISNFIAIWFWRSLMAEATA